jgi:hypothetical protein
VAPQSPDFLGFVDAMDRAWHGSVSASRELVARWWALTTSGAARLDPGLPRTSLADATVLRGLRPVDATVDTDDEGYDRLGRDTHVVLEAGSALGHRRGQASWVVQVVPPGGEGTRFRALQRVRLMRRMVERCFEAPALAVLLDHGGSASLPSRFDSETLVLGADEIRAATDGLRINWVTDLPGAPWDRTLVKLGLMRALAATSPENVDGFVLARRAAELGWPVRRPVEGPLGLHDNGMTLAAWVEQHPETPAMVRARIGRVLAELEDAGMIRHADTRPTLTYAGGDVVLALMAFVDEERSR